MALNNNLGKKPLNFKREIIDTLKFILSVVIIIGIGFVVINYVPFIAKYNHYIIATNSMEPIINVGDVVIVDSGINLDDLKKDQIIAFYADIRGDGRKVVVVHYLDSVSEVDGVRIFRTRPEINDSIDPWKLKDEDIIGIHKLTIPKIGPVLLFAQSTMGRIVLIIDVVVIYVIFSVLFPSKPKQKKVVLEETTKDN